MESKNLIIGIIIGSLIGASTGYFASTMLRGSNDEINAQLLSVTQSLQEMRYELNELNEANEQLKTDIDVIQDNYDTINEKYLELETEHGIILGKIDDLLEVNESYIQLLNSLDMIRIKQFTQRIEYNISAGTDRTWQFFIEKYGIIWEATISFSGDYVSMSHSWQRGDERYFVGSSGRSLTYKDSPDIPYYGYQEYLWGDISVEWYNDSDNPNRIWVYGKMMSNLPTVWRDGHAYIDTSEWIIN